jgi:hypothetical protein
MNELLKGEVSEREAGETLESLVYWDYVASDWVELGGN